MEAMLRDEKGAVESSLVKRWSGGLEDVESMKNLSMWMGHSVWCFLCTFQARMVEWSVSGSLSSSGE